MIVLDNGDKIRGDASAVTVVDYTLHGVVTSTLTQLADGQLADSIGDLYTAGAIVVVTTIILVNTDGSARTVNLYLTPSGGTARRLIPKDTSLGVGYSLHFDGAKVSILNPTGGVVTSYGVHAASHTDGTDDVRDATNALKGLATAAQITKLEGIATGATVYPDTGEQAFLDADHAKLDGIDTGADVTGDNAPKAHKASHENTGGDEISVAGLSGLLADDQHVLDTEVVTAAKTVKLDDFTAPDDTTDLNATDSLHGLMPKADKGKLDGVEAAADVTDTTNVNAVVKRIVYVKVLANDTALTTGDGKAYITIPSDLNGMNLIDADIAVYTTSSSGNPTVQLHNLDYAGGAQDMLSTLMTIDAGGTELSSYTAATPPVINGSYDDVATGDRIRIDVDVAGTGTKGLDVILVFQTP